MSPWRMMNEWGLPGVEMWSLTQQYCERLAKKGEYVPDIILAGGFTLEDQMFKGFALGAPYVKAIGMARSPLAAAMVGKTIGKEIEAGQEGSVGMGAIEEKAKLQIAVDAGTGRDQ